MRFFEKTPHKLMLGTAAASFAAIGIVVLAASASAPALEPVGCRLPLATQVNTAPAPTPPPVTPTPRPRPLSTPSK